MMHRFLLSSVLASSLVQAVNVGQDSIVTLRKKTVITETKVVYESHQHDKRQASSVVNYYLATMTGSDFGGKLTVVSDRAQAATFENKNNKLLISDTAYGPSGFPVIYGTPDPITSWTTSGGDALTQTMAVTNSLLSLSNPALTIATDNVASFCLVPNTPYVWASQVMSGFTRGQGGCDPFDMVISTVGATAPTSASSPTTTATQSTSSSSSSSSSTTSSATCAFTPVSSGTNKYPNSRYIFINAFDAATSSHRGLLAISDDSPRRIMLVSPASAQYAEFHLYTNGSLACGTSDPQNTGFSTNLDFGSISSSSPPGNYIAADQPAGSAYSFFTTNQPYDNHLSVQNSNTCAAVSFCISTDASGDTGTVGGETGGVLRVYQNDAAAAAASIPCNVVNLYVVAPNSGS